LKQVVATKAYKLLEGIAVITGDVYFLTVPSFEYTTSLPGCTYDKLVSKEKNYIHRRYPQISANNIIFEKVQAQPDGTCCGIYAAAFATTVALGGNPNKKYSNRVEYMRQHFLNIIIENELSPFPKWYKF